MTLAGEDLVGAPWVAGGRSAAGIDCLGVVLVVAARLGIPVEEPRDAVERLAAMGWTITPGDFPDGWAEVRPPYRVGDVVVLWDDAARAENHVGIVDTPGHVLHATFGAGTVRTPVGRLARRIRRAYRWTVREGDRDGVRETDSRTDSRTGARP
jgi:cell wall-associated NlpC family hydrolase